jgi:hypothetical protein
MPLEGEFGNLCHHSIRRMPGDRNLLSLDASLAISTRVLRFEVSGLHHRTLVRPVLLTGQTGTHRSDWSEAAAAPSLVLRSWLCGSTEEPSCFLVNHQKPSCFLVNRSNEPVFTIYQSNWRFLVKEVSPGSDTTCKESDAR